MCQGSGRGQGFGKCRVILFSQDTLQPVSYSLLMFGLAMVLYDGVSLTLYIYMGRPNTLDMRCLSLAAIV